MASTSSGQRSCQINIPRLFKSCAPPLCKSNRRIVTFVESWRDICRRKWTGSWCLCNSVTSNGALASHSSLQLIVASYLIIYIVLKEDIRRDITPKNLWYLEKSKNGTILYYNNFKNLVKYCPIHPNIVAVFAAGTGLQFLRSNVWHCGCLATLRSDRLGRRGVDDMTFGLVPPCNLHQFAVCFHCCKVPVFFWVL